MVDPTLGTPSSRSRYNVTSAGHPSCLASQTKVKNVVFVMGTYDNPCERHLCAVPLFASRGDGGVAAPVRLTQAPCMHSVVMDHRLRRCLQTRGVHLSKRVPVTVGACHGGCVRVGGAGGFFACVGLAEVVRWGSIEWRTLSTACMGVGRDWRNFPCGFFGAVGTARVTVGSNGCN